MRPKLEPTAERAGVSAIAILWVAIALGVAALCSDVILSGRRDAEAQALTAATNLTGAIAKGISQDFQVYDRGMFDIISNLNAGTLDRLHPSERKTLLFQALANSPYIDDIYVLDPHGRVVEDAHDFPLAGKDFSEREYFAPLSAEDGLGLYIGKPFLSAMAGGDWTVTLSRRISGPDGSFKGVVVASLSLGYFENLFENLKAGPSDVFSVLRIDGSMIMRRPFRMGNLGRTYLSPSLLAEAAERGSFTDQKIAATDGIRRVYSYARVGNLPMLVATGLSKEDIFASWKTKAEEIGAIAVGLVAAMAGMAWLLARELLRRRAAELRLSALAERLAIDARTDALTGLANRRAFDEVAADEWSRAIAMSGMISLLVIDVDHFKHYNDRYGHRQGDEALITVARRIDAQVEPPFAARHGGEEFVALLPGVALDGAWAIAESIRRSVALERFEQGGSVTVSIGAACFEPKEGALFSKAFMAADAALYRAKQSGRNRTWTTPVGDPDPDLIQAAFPRSPLALR